MNLPQPAALSVLSGGAVQRGLENLAKLFQEQTDRNVVLAFATAPAIRGKLENQESSPDVVIAPLSTMEEFTSGGRVVAGSSAVIGSVRAGVVVRKGAPEPDISTAAAFKQELLASQSLVYNEGSSGIFVERLLEKLGIGEVAKAKTTRYPDAEGVMKHLADSRTAKEIGFGQITAILLRADQGIKLVGPLPREIENVTVYAAGICAGATAPEIAAQFIRFLITPSAKDTFRATGVE